MTRRPAVTAAAAGLLLAVASGCGVPTESRPGLIPDDRLPAALSSPPPRPRATPVDATVFNVYLIDEERLRPVPRAVVGDVNLAGRLEALRAGPTADEAGAGLRSALNEEASIRISRVSAAVATVDLPLGLAELVGSDQVLALAQLVFTLSEDPVIDEVLFTVEGEPVAAPVEDGTLLGRAVGRSDFPTLLTLM